MLILIWQSGSDLFGEEKKPVSSSSSDEDVEETEQVSHDWVTH